jgi:tRNA(Ile)-lysidine synthase
VSVELLERVAATGLLDGDVVVLLSGGRDSVCLLDIAVALRGPVRALHVNYGLRGADSDADEAYCRELCSALGVELVVERATWPGRGNVQAWARAARYAAAAAELGPPPRRAAVGHTLTDQVETILYRLATSPGRRALLGMPVQTDALVRPLLAAEVTRAETAAWCQARGLGWREDASNADRSYARARVREELVPALRAVDERAETNVLRTAELLAQEAAVLDEVVAEVLGGGASIEVARLRALPAALARLVVRRLAEDATGALCARAAARLDDVLALGSGALDLGDGARAIVRDGVLTFGRTPERVARQ